MSRFSGPGRLRPPGRGVSATIVAIALALALATAGAASAQGPGSPDPAFNSSGFVATVGQLLGVAVQSNGEIVAAGQSGGRVLVERFTAAGGSDGAYLGPAGVARAVAVQPDGHIVIAGSSGGAMLVERLTSSLAPDGSFGSGGIATAFAGQGGLANSVALGPSGEIVAAGSIGSAPTTAAVAEFTAGGGASAQTFGLGGNSLFGAVAVQSNGNIVAVGQRNPGQAVNAVIAILNAQGSQLSASTYDAPGSGGTSFGGVAIQNNGQIVVAGRTADSSGKPAAVFLRYNGSGTLDTAFGSQGATILPASQNLNINPGGLVGANGVGIAGGGAIIGAGPFENGAATVYAATWGLSSSGNVLSGYGAGGTSLGPPFSASPSYEACALAIAPYGSPNAGEIVTVGDTPQSPNVFPCATGESANGYVGSYIGLGPPPPPAPPVTGAAPTVSTGAARAVAETSATLTGAVNPNGLPTAYGFDYGKSTAYGLHTSPASAGSGTAADAVSANLSGLSPSTTYHYRLVATNADGTVNGADSTFTTGAAPTATTRSATAGEVSATISGLVNAHGLATSYHFDYGKTAAYAAQTAARSASGAGDVGVSAHLTQLRPGTTYHYRIVARNAAGIVYGGDRTFKTAPRLTSRLRGVGGAYRTATVVKPGLSSKVTCSQACSITGSLVISSATAKRLGLGKRQLTIGAGGASLKRGGTARLVVRLKQQYTTALSKRARLAVTFRTVSRPRGGGPSVVHQLKITLKR